MNAEDDDLAAGDDLGDPNERRSQWQDVLTAFRAPTIPIVEPWSISIATLIGSAYKVPSIASKALAQLDRVGALRLTSEAITFDTDDVEWNKLSTVRCRPAGEVLADSAVRREIDSVRKVLPPIPGRKWVVNRLADGVSQVATIALERVGGLNSRRAIATELEYRGGLGRRRSTESGVVVSALLAVVPDLNDVVLRMAQQHGARIEGYS